MKAKEKTQNQAEPAAIVPVANKPVYLALAFVFPFVIMGTAFALNKVFPFGDRQIIVLDFFDQYFPFINDLWHKLRNGSLSTWSWAAGMGHDYIALAIYYLTSPLNLLAFLAPQPLLREALTLVLLIKIGCAGLFTSIFLRYTFKQTNSSLPVFSSLYALCAFTLGYYWNIIWFDSFALLPLVMMGLVAFMREGKYRLYIVSLALAILTNFYIGLYICIFVLITFLGLCIMQNISLRNFLRKLATIATCSSLAIGMIAVIIIPACSALQNIYKADGDFPTKLIVYKNFFDVLGNFIAFTPPTVTDGLPNLYCGMISVLLVGLFLFSQKVPRREKIVITGIAIFLLASCNLNILDYLLNGFRFPNSVPFRYSFLLSFTLVVMAYRTFLLTESMSAKKMLAVGISTTVVLLAAVFGSQHKNYIIGSAILCAIYLLLFYLMNKKAGKWHIVIRSIFFIFIFVELIISSYIAVAEAKTYPRGRYFDHNNQIQALLNKRQPAGASFYRTDIDDFHTYNDPYFYGYNGISFYSSTANANVTRFINGLGLFGKDNTINYVNTSPLICTFLNMRYLISRSGNPPANGVHWNTVAKFGNLLLLENKRYLPLGFMVNKDTADYTHHNNNPFLSQNNLFQRATGLKGSLFTISELADAAPAFNDDTNNIPTKNYIMPSDGILCAYFKACDIKTPYISQLNEDARVVILVNGNLFRLFDNHKVFPIHVVGIFSQGDIISFVARNGISINIGVLDSELFDQGYNLLAAQPLQLTKFSNTQVCGNVTALEDSLLYTSIPGNKNWSAFVDGKKSEIVLIDSAMIAVRLNKGAHKVEFRYFNKSFLAGIIVSLVSLGVFAMMIMLNKRTI